MCDAGNTNRAVREMNSILLGVDKLSKHYPVRTGLFLGRTRGLVRAVENVSFEIGEHSSFGLVGESGCGKTTISKMLLLLEPVTSGSIYFQGTKLESMQKAQLYEYKHSIQAVFQDPTSSLSPRMRVRDIIGEPLAVLGRMSTREIFERVQELLNIVGLSSDSAGMFPHEFSGGQRQRIAIARSLSINPKFIVLDEPVSALDVSIQAQILNLLMDIQQQLGITYLIIAHDLAVVEHISDVVGVMYLGKLVETAPSEELYNYPQHPYTKALLASVPVPDPDFKKPKLEVKGDVANPLRPPSGCRFNPRCPLVMAQCSQEEPPMIEVSPGHKVACHSRC
jgi:oligopeptide transport system ATP-binding protein